MVFYFAGSEHLKIMGFATGEYAFDDIAVPIFCLEGRFEIRLDLLGDQIYHFPDRKRKFRLIGFICVNAEFP